MALRIGQVLRGAKGSYELLRPLKGSTVFKAKVLSQANKPEWAVVKTAATDLEKMALRREYHNYGIPSIASSPYIRSMCDTVRINEAQEEPSCLVFEWMEQDLWSIDACRIRSDPKLPRLLCKAVLSALSVFEHLNAIHTDINPNNIFLSNIDSASPVIKLGDLGVAMQDGSIAQRVQSLPCRAPEVWQGHPCCHASDIWSLGVTLTTALSPLLLFGHADKRIADNTEAWCIAKIMRLVGPMDLPTDPVFRKEFEFARKLEAMDHPLGHIKLISRQHWRTELEYMTEPPASQELLDFIATLLVIDPKMRPTASQALMHPYLKPQLSDTMVFRDIWPQHPIQPQPGKCWTSLELLENGEINVEEHVIAA